MTLVKKNKAAMLAISLNIVLIAAKLIAGSVSGSVSIISDAIHSFSDLLTSIMAFFSVKKSAEPADKNHPFGHGKFEDLSGFIEGIIISLAGLFIIKEAVSKIISGVNPELETTLGIFIILICIILNYSVSSYMEKVGKETDSMAIKADAAHLKTDVITSIGVLIALIAIKFTGITIIDPIVAILVALLVLITGYNLCKAALESLLDVSLPKEQKIIIKDIVKNHIPAHITAIKDIKTRKSGPLKVIELTLIVPQSMSIKNGHDLCDKIEEEIEEHIGNTEVMIHLEPCDNSCQDCSKHR